MSRPRKKKPDYCLDRASNRAYVRIDGKRIYLGGHGTPESHDKYDQVVGEWIAGGRQGQQFDDDGFTVAQIIAAFWDYAEKVYPPPRPAKRGKRPMGELGNFWGALRPLSRLYGSTPAKKFGPLALKAVREDMIKTGWCRKQINKQIGRLRMVFKWAVENELLPGEVHYRLSAVAGLKPGRSEAKESERVRPVLAAHIDAIIPFVSDQVGAMIKLELLCGARGGELCAMKISDIDTSKRVWVYKPAKHKTFHHGHERIIRFGERCKQILQPFLTGRLNLSAYVFSPEESEHHRHAKLRAARKTPVQPSQVKRAEKSRRRKRQRAPHDHYDSGSYRRAVQRGCDRAFPPPAPLCKRAGESEPELELRLTPEQKAELKAWKKSHSWHPHQLRHNFATNIRRDFGPDAANILLGHSTLSATQIYAAIDEEKAEKIMAEVG